MTVVLELRGIVRRFGDGARTATVLDGVDLELRRGEVVALVGRSGSGKTTLFDVASGFQAPDAGEVHPQRAGAVAAWADVAVVPQALGLLDELTVAENVALPGRLGGGGGDVGALLARLRIAHLADRLPAEVSLGEQQRAAVARAAVAAPRVLLADEPVAHQNDALAQVVLEVIADLAAAGTACLVASHDPAVVGIAHRVLSLDGGRLVDATGVAAP